MEKTHQNYKKYREGKEPLANAVLQHPDSDSNNIYDYLKGKISRNFWIIPFADWQEKQKHMKDNG